MVENIFSPSLWCVDEYTSQSWPQNGFLKGFRTGKQKSQQSIERCQMKEGKTHRKPYQHHLIKDKISQSCPNLSIERINDDILSWEKIFNNFHGNSDMQCENCREFSNWLMGSRFLTRSCANAKQKLSPWDVSSFRELQKSKTSRNHYTPFIPQSIIRYSTLLRVKQWRPCGTYRRPWFLNFSTVDVHD